MKSQESKFLCSIFILAIIALLPAALRAQVQYESAGSTAANDAPSKWDIFVGYSYLEPHGSVSVLTYQNIDFGGIVSAARYFNKYVGLQFEGDAHDESQDWPPNSNSSATNSNDDFFNAAAGVIFRFPFGAYTPFVHGLFGKELVGSLYQTDTWGWAATAGGGLDYSTPWLHHHLAIRLVQADYQYASIPFAPDFGGASSFNIARLSGGVVFHFDSIEPPSPLTMACTPNPVFIYPGDPITVTASAANLDPKLHAVYFWTGSGATGSEATAEIATESLTPGSYTVNATVKEGQKAWETAACSAVFTVKPFDPPSIRCMSIPDAIKPGESSTISTIATSPQNRPLVLSYSAAAGSVSGSSLKAKFSSAGAPTGDVEITCNVKDDKGGNATAKTTVTISEP